MSKASQNYLELVSQKILALEKAQNKNLNDISKKIFESIESGGVWNLFGSGHSHMAVEEAFHRAGGLIPINPMLEEYLMPHAGPSRNGPMERMPGLAQIIFDYYAPKSGEVLTVISNSGINQ